MAQTALLPADLRFWLGQIEDYEREFKPWEARVDAILKRYRDTRSTRKVQGETRFNVLWSNVQILRRATFSRLPKPDVSRRFRDSDPVGRVASLILERALEFEIQHYDDYRKTLANDVLDRFLGGRGTAWVRYEPHFMPTVQVTDDAAQAQDEGAQEEIDYECSPVDYVNWRDFGHSVARTWEESRARWRRVYMDRDALVKRFGEEVGGKIPLDCMPEELKKEGMQLSPDKQQAAIYEIWDKTNGKAIWLSKSYPQIIEEKPDPLQLDGFFPCPTPLTATITTDSLVPVPDFVYYQDQAKTLDMLADRIDGLVKALKVRGVYNSAVPELSRLFTEGTQNTLIPVTDWTAFVEKAGLKGAIDLVDLKNIYEALRAAYDAFMQVKGQIYEIMGISDIVRGETEAQETATAQALKGQYANLRISEPQQQVAEFASEILQIKAQIMCQRYQPQTLLQIAAVEQLSEQDRELIPQALQLLSRNTLRDFRIEVAADSLIAMDERQEKQDAMEMLQAVGSYFKEAMPLASAAPPLVPLIMELLKFGITRFKVGRTIEGQFDEVAEQLKALAAQPKPPQPDPKLEAAKVKAQADTMQTQGEMQMQPMRMQAEQAKSQADLMMANMDLEKAKVMASMPMQPMMPGKGMPQ